MLLQKLVYVGDSHLSLVIWSAAYKVFLSINVNPKGSVSPKNLFFRVGNLPDLSSRFHCFWQWKTRISPEVFQSIELSTQCAAPGMIANTMEEGSSQSLDNISEIFDLNSLQNCNFHITYSCDNGTTSGGQRHFSKFPVDYYQRYWWVSCKCIQRDNVFGEVLQFHDPWWLTRR